MSSHKSTAKGCAAKAALADPESLVRFADLLKLHSLAASTQAEYLRYVRKLAARVGRDPADLEEAQVRAHLLHLKDAHHYSPSSMRTAVAAMRSSSLITRSKAAARSRSHKPRCLRRGR